MKRQLALATLATFAAALVAVQAASSGDRAAAVSDVVFVQTNEPAGNRIVVFDRAGDGRLTQAGAYPTGGRGGVASPGAESDHLASQGSLVYDDAHRLLFAVNAGSDTVSTFEVSGNALGLTDVTASGGD